MGFFFFIIKNNSSLMYRYKNKSNSENETIFYSQLSVFSTRNQYLNRYRTFIEKLHDRASSAISTEKSSLGTQNSHFFFLKLQFLDRINPFLHLLLPIHRIIQSTIPLSRLPINNHKLLPIPRDIIAPAKQRSLWQFTY